MCNGKVQKRSAVKRDTKGNRKNPVLSVRSQSIFLSRVLLQGEDCVEQGRWFPRENETFRYRNHSCEIDSVSNKLNLRNGGGGTACVSKEFFF